MDVHDLERDAAYICCYSEHASFRYHGLSDLILRSEVFPNARDDAARIGFTPGSAEHMRRAQPVQIIEVVRTTVDLLKRNNFASREILADMRQLVRAQMRVMLVSVEESVGVPGTQSKTVQSAYNL